jgi:ABC-type uncharacterized transport system ATPase subunit
VWLRVMLRHLADTQGRTVLVSSHVLAEVEQAVDRVVIIARGRLLYDGTLRDLDAGSGTVVVRTPTPDALAAALAPLHATVTASADGSVTIAGFPLLSVVGLLRVLGLFAFSWNLYWAIFLAILGASFVPELVWRKYA